MTNTSPTDSKVRKSSAQDAILDAAESLFGQFGPEGVSLRQIGAAAGSANNSAVQYHFRSKEGLLDGIYSRRLASLERRRTALLAEPDGAATDTRHLLANLLLPIAEERDSAGRCSYAAFLLGMYLYGDIARWNDHAEQAPVTLRINRALRASLGHLPDDVFGARLLAAVVSFLMAVVDWDRRAAQGIPQRFASREQYLQQMLDFAAVGFAAPVLFSGGEKSDLNA